MDSVEVGRVALMSIRPRFARGLLDGTKRVEFRKRRIAGDVTHVVIYATAPTKGVVGAFVVDGQETKAPEDLWEEFQDEAGVGEHDFFDYFDDYAVGTGIRVGNVMRAKEVLDLQEVAGLAHPPQSFVYLERRLAEAILLKLSTEWPSGDDLRTRTAVART